MALDVAREAVHVAEPVHHHQAALVASRQHIALLLQGAAEGFRAVGGLVCGGDFLAALLGGDAGFLRLRLLAERRLEFLLFELLSLLPGLQAGRQIEAVFPGELAGEVHELAVVVRHVDRPHPVHVDARPDDMAVLAPVLDMKDDGARLVGEAEPVLDDADGLDYTARG